MKVAVAYEAGHPLTLEDLPVPDIGPRDVLVRISASGTRNAEGIRTVVV